MAIVALDDMKAHLGVTDVEDDDLISAKLDAAQAHIEQQLGFAIADQFPDETPADLLEAVRQWAAHLFENREAVAIGLSVAEVPGVADVIANRRAYTGWSDGYQEP